MVIGFHAFPGLQVPDTVTELNPGMCRHSLCQERGRNPHLGITLLPDATLNGISQPS